MSNGCLEAGQVRASDREKEEEEKKALQITCTLHKELVVRGLKKRRRTTKSPARVAYVDDVEVAPLSKS